MLATEPPEVFVGFGAPILAPTSGTVMAHLRHATVNVAAGAVVEVGETIGSYGNSGSSTQPHVHVQVTDSTVWPTARGRPIVFEQPHVRGVNWLPSSGEAFNAS